MRASHIASDSRVYPVSALPGKVGSFSAAPVGLPDQVATTAFRENAEIVPLPVKFRPPVTEQLLADCREIVRKAFPAPSRNAACIDAERKTRIPYDVWARILGEKTARLDFNAVLQAMAFYQIETGQWPTIAGLVIQISMEARA